MLRARYGAKGKEIFNIARLYDNYVAWHNTNYLETSDQEAKDQAALASALAGEAFRCPFILTGLNRSCSLKRDVSRSGEKMACELTMPFVVRPQPTSSPWPSRPQHKTQVKPGASTSFFSFYRA